ncbi:hypothetical protein GCM10017044_03780 [Kordiimonas sediminis]|uniref:Uncharacterized protein n=1 Tax=Kordiimonas sediminis TaxID=1735581 RepID=A0A919AKR9_9PROT|nr:hypothetical protein [Kordiimonas sediminis]GHF13041.1 hypothetical protein GCM10017044_03780 [Kordiimonas sediminis]
MTDRKETDSNPERDTAQGTPDPSDTIIDAEILAEDLAEETTESADQKGTRGAGQKKTATSSYREDTSPVTKSGGGKAGWILSGFLIAFIGGVFAAPYGEQTLVDMGLLPAQDAAVEPAASVPDTSGLTARLDQVEKTNSLFRETSGHLQASVDSLRSDVKTLQDQLSLLAVEGGLSPDAVGAMPTEMQAELDRLSGEIARLSALNAQANPDVTKLTGSLALLRAELEQQKAMNKALVEDLEAIKSGAIETSPRGRLVLMLGRVKDLALSGQAYGVELASLRPDFATLSAMDQQLIGADLAILEAGQNGIPSYAVLVSSFEAMARDVSAATEKASGSFLVNLFTVRRRGAGATGNDAVLVEAENALGARNVAGAVAALSKLTPDAAEVAKPWTESAQRYVDVLGAFDRLVLAASKSEG